MKAVMKSVSPRMCEKVANGGASSDKVEYSKIIAQTKIIFSKRSVKMRKSTKIMVVATIIVIIVLCLTACNKTVFDTKYKFEKAHIRINDEWFDVNVSKWNDYEGEQIQLILTDGSVIVIHSRDCILYNGTLPAPQKN